MRSLRVTLRTTTPITLPLAYNELLQGLLYSTWSDRYPNLHDCAIEGQSFRPFVFGRLEGRSTVDKERRTIRFYDQLNFEVRTPLEELLDECATQLASRTRIQLGAYELKLANLMSQDQLLFPRQAKIHLRTPAVAYIKTDDSHTHYLSPADAGWADIVQGNAKRKAVALDVQCDSQLAIIPLEETLRKQVTRFKGTYITGWTGDLIVACDSQMLALLWCLGIGEKNSQGFGLFDLQELT